MLSGRVRVSLLRILCERSGLSVKELAQEVGVGISNASQELRRIQSRGFLQAERKKCFVYYRLKPDPLVPSAKPLVEAVQNSLHGEDDEEGVVHLAFALAHFKRVAIVGALLKEPKSRIALAAELQFPMGTLWRHLELLKDGGFVQCSGHTVRLCVPEHPLAQELIRLIEKKAAKRKL